MRDRSLPHEGEPPSEAALLRGLISHYESVAEQADSRLDPAGDQSAMQVARAARREAAALRRELRTIRLLGWDRPSDPT